MGISIKDAMARRKLEKAIDALSPRVRKQILGQVARSLLRAMRERVEIRGEGSNGKLMQYKGQFYSEMYARHREATGRTTQRRTLSFTAKMHGARKVRKLTDTSAIIGWPVGPAAEKAQGNEDRTPFVRPTKDEDRQVRLDMNQRFKRAVRLAPGLGPR